MKVGIGFPYGLPPAEALGVIEACERAGVASAWVVENPYWQGAFATAGALAARTATMEIGIGVVSAFTRSPAIIAMEAAQVQAISGGRLVLGLGVGGPRVLADLGIDVPNPLAAMEESLAVLRALLGDGVAAHDGFHRLRDVRLSFEVPAPPLVVGTIGPRMTALAGRVADGLIVSAHVPVAEVARLVADYRRAGERRPECGRVTAFLVAAIDDDPAAARARLKPDLAVTMGRLLRIPSLVPVLTATGLSRSDLEHAASCADGAVGRTADEVADAVVDELCLAGDVPAAVRRLTELCEVGVDEVVLLQAGEHPGFARHAAEIVRAVERERPGPEPE